MRRYGETNQVISVGNGRARLTSLQVRKTEGKFWWEKDACSIFKKCDFSGVCIWGGGVIGDMC